MSSSFAEMIDIFRQYFAEARPFLPMYLHLLVAALFPIYTGAHASLSRPSSAAKPKKRSVKTSADSGSDEEDENEDEDNEEEQTQRMEGLSPSDAIVFPVTAAIVLAGLYFLIQRYGAAVINLILGWYFSGIGIFSVSKLLNDAADLIRDMIFPTYFAEARKLYRTSLKRRKAINVQDRDHSTPDAIDRPSPIARYLPSYCTNLLWVMSNGLRKGFTIKGYLHELFEFKSDLSTVGVVATLVGIISILYANLVDKPWWLINLQGFAVCYSAMQFMSPTTFATGSLILTGLFFYDIWAVFFTPMMVTVAKNLDQPIKLLFPRPDEPSEIPGEPPVKGYSMLGLGDIVLPGLMIGLALRFDLYMFYLKKQISRSNEGDATNVVVEKAKYYRTTGRWGDWFWTRSLPSHAMPAVLNVSFPKPYFTASVIGYVIGMVCTLVVMSVFKHAQPALLYLVPAVLSSLWVTGLLRGEVQEMWCFSEALTGDQIDADTADKEKGTGQEQGRKPGESWSQYLWRDLFGTAEEKEGNEDKNTSAKTWNDMVTHHQEKGLLFSLSIAWSQSKQDRRRSSRPTKSTTNDMTSMDKSGRDGSDLRSDQDQKVIGETMRQRGANRKQA